jgi:hypothetical protein
MSISVLTRGYNNCRSGANRHESVLTAAAVGARGIKRLLLLSMMRRSMFASWPTADKGR